MRITTSTDATKLTYQNCIYTENANKRATSSSADSKHLRLHRMHRDMIGWICTSLWQNIRHIEIQTKDIIQATTWRHFISPEDETQATMWSNSNDITSRVSTNQSPTDTTQEAPSDGRNCPRDVVSWAASSGHQSSDNTLRMLEASTVDSSIYWTHFITSSVQIWTQSTYKKYLFLTCKLIHVNSFSPCRQRWGCTYEDDFRPWRRLQTMVMKTTSGHDADFKPWWWRRLQAMMPTSNHGDEDDFRPWCRLQTMVMKMTSGHDADFKPWWWRWLQAMTPTSNHSDFMTTVMETMLNHGDEDDLSHGDRDYQAMHSSLCPEVIIIQWDDEDFRPWWWIWFQAMAWRE